ncbi:MAG TPA: nucleotide exchange factor GrpE [Candidatus Paceibacterota bacterium]|mgnify:FL=1|nr:nucleotide exchange factor GrpE [Candidatus Paceibacterota bacterium]HOK97385.1 nucleotide exchange factor GrpE [Candidatus Paceibacterota bacterium]HPP64850.1 nucleotide exchange factor GrpE [Candidatus Paceibacterota bacterium]
MANEERKEEKTEKEESLKEELDKLKKEKEELFNDWQKARAELINYKKEEKERLSEVIRFSNERIIKELITVLDSFELALNSLKNEEESMKEKYLKGVILIKSQLEEILKREGLEEIPVEKGKIPDLNYMEIVSEIVTNRYPKNTVAEVFQKGYLLNGKMLRPARVAVEKEIKN